MIFCNKSDYGDARNVESAFPNVAKIIALNGGWAVFKTLQDYDMWKMKTLKIHGGDR